MKENEKKEKREEIKKKKFNLFDYLFMIYLWSFDYLFMIYLLSFDYLFFNFCYYYLIKETRQRC